MGGREPTDEQWRAISWPLEPYVLVAGAGSGKTSVMAARVVYLALVAFGRLDGRPRQGVLPGNVLCLTFTNKATENLQQRIRHALAELELAEGEEPEIMNYHGFAAQLLDRYGMLAGIEPDQRVLSPAQRTELCARVMDLMTFEHVKTESQGGVIDNILLLDDQASNHRRTPEEIIAFNEAALEQLKEHRSDRAYRSALERIELARGAAIFRQLKRDLGVIDFGDQISLALKVVEEHPQVAAEYRQRFGAVLLDEYQDTDVAQAKLIAGVFGGGHPGDGRRRPRPEHLRVARRQPVQPAGLPGAVPARRRHAVRAAAAVHELPLGRVDPRGGRRRRSRSSPKRSGPTRTSGCVPWLENGTGEVHVARISDEWKEAEWIADHIARAARAAARSGPTSPCSAGRAGCSSRCSRRSRNARSPAEIVGLAGLLRLPEVVEVLAYARAVSDPLASVALARILLGPRYRVGFKDLARVAALAKRKNYALRRRTRRRARRRRSCSPRRSSISTRSEGSPTRRASGSRSSAPSSPSCASRRASRWASSWARSSAGRAPRGARRAHRHGRGRGGRQAQPRRVHRPGARVRAGRGRADAPRVPGLRRHGRAAGQAGVVAGAALGRGLGEGHDDPRGEGAGVRQRVRARHGEGLLPSNRIQHNPAERGKSMDFELRGDAKILPTFDGVLSQFKEDLQAQEEYEERRTAYVALTRARRRLFCTGAHWYGENIKAKEGGQVPARAGGLGAGDAARNVRSRRGHR